jgi:hypothetical protein
MAQTFPAELKLRPVYWPRCASYVREIRGRQTFIAIRLCTVWSLFRLRHSGRFAPTDCFGTILVSFPDAPNDDVGDQTHDRGNDQRHQELAHGCGLLITEQRKPILYVSLRGVGRMSAIGTKRTFHFSLHMSALGGKADTALSRRGSAIPSKLSAKFARGVCPARAKARFAPPPSTLGAEKSTPLRESNRRALVASTWVGLGVCKTTAKK